MIRTSLDRASTKGSRLGMSKTGIVLTLLMGALLVVLGRYMSREDSSGLVAARPSD